MEGNGFEVSWIEGWVVCWICSYFFVVFRYCNFKVNLGELVYYLVSSDIIWCFNNGIIKINNVGRISREGIFYFVWFEDFEGLFFLDILLVDDFLLFVE